MNEKYKINDLPNGIIVWSGNTILGIKGATLNEKYHDYYCYKIMGNYFDYELVEKV